MRFGDVEVKVNATSTRIRFRDGGEICGEPEDTDAYRATALRLGYGGDTLQMCKDHEVLHVVLSHLLGIDSPTLTLLRRGDDPALHHLNGLEEDVILALQRFARSAGVDLMSRMSWLEARCVP